MSAAAVRAPWTNVYGVGRTLLALCTLVTLTMHSPDELFRPLGIALSSDTGLPGPAGMSLFNLLGPDRLELARWIAVAILLAAASGWRPRVTGLLHWWVAFSFTSSAVVVDGGDHVATVLTLLLLPVTLTDPRRWHWSAAPSVERTREKAAALVAASALLACRVQVAVIYLHAATGKFAVEEWANGTALYYWMLQPTYGIHEVLRPLLVPVLADPLAVTLMTWGVMSLELLLFTGLVMERRWRRPLFWAGLGFHAAIIVVHGLVTFFISMAGALVLFLRPYDEPYAWPDRVRAAVPARVRPVRLRRAPAAEPAPPVAALPE